MRPYLFGQSKIYTGDSKLWKFRSFWCVLVDRTTLLKIYSTDSLFSSIYFPLVFSLSSPSLPFITLSEKLELHFLIGMNRSVLCLAPVLSESLRLVCVRIIERSSMHSEKSLTAPWMLRSISLGLLPALLVRRSWRLFNLSDPSICIKLQYRVYKIYSRVQNYDKFTMKMVYLHQYRLDSHHSYKARQDPPPLLILSPLTQFEIFLKSSYHMLKGLYDTDCSTFSPQGKLFQVEYAMEAVKQGSICLGIRSDTHVVLCSLKRQPSDLAGHQQKMFKVDDRIGMAMSGLTADARVLCKYMRNECINHRYTFDTSHPLNRLLFKIAEKSQTKTQNYSKRPYGVGLLIAGIDSEGPHLFETCPSGNYYEYYCWAIGARSQSAKTYLQNNMAKFHKASPEQLILHSISALKKSASEENEVDEKSIEIGIVSRDIPFRMLTLDQLKSSLEKVKAFNPESQMQTE